MVQKDRPVCRRFQPQPANRVLLVTTVNQVYLDDLAFLEMLECVVLTVCQDRTASAETKVIEVCLVSMPSLDFRVNRVIEESLVLLASRVHLVKMVF